LALLRHDRLMRLIAGARELGLRRTALLFLLLLGSAVAPMGFMLRHEYLTFLKQVMANGSLLAIHGATLAALAMALPHSMLER
jgi:uncharacterized membrane protein